MGGSTRAQGGVNGRGGRIARPVGGVEVHGEGDRDVEVRGGIDRGVRVRGGIDRAVRAHGGIDRGVGVCVGSVPGIVQAPTVYPRLKPGTRLAHQLVGSVHPGAEVSTPSLARPASQFAASVHRRRATWLIVSDRQNDRFVI